MGTKNFCAAGPQARGEGKTPFIVVGGHCCSTGGHVFIRQWPLCRSQGCLSGESITSSSSSAILPFIAMAISRAVRRFASIAIRLAPLQTQETYRIWLLDMWLSSQ